jgi:sugar phosphate isomerase/epimerase
MTRRTALSVLAGAPAAAAAPAPPAAIPVCMFTKHLQWTSLAEAAPLAAELGFDGLDITVRPGGHIAPERVEEELPRALEHARRAGIGIPMITSGIVDTATPHAERVVRTCAGLGIRRYRWGGFRYRESAPLPAQLAEFELRVRDLAALNRQYGVCAMYHTHSGRDQVGASFWDLYLLLKPFSPDEVAANFDIGHATVEGGLGGWLHSARLLLPYARGISVKDVRWRKAENGAWQPDWCALGQGMVRLPEFFKLVKQSGFAGPLQLHYEYPELGGAASGQRKSTVPREELLRIFRRDLTLLRSLLRQAGVTA